MGIPVFTAIQLVHLGSEDQDAKQEIGMLEYIISTLRNSDVPTLTDMARQSGQPSLDAALYKAAAALIGIGAHPERAEEVCVTALQALEIVLEKIPSNRKRFEIGLNELAQYTSSDKVQINALNLLGAIRNPTRSASPRMNGPDATLGN